MHQALPLPHKNKNPCGPVTAAILFYHWKGTIYSSLPSVHPFSFLLSIYLPGPAFIYSISSWKTFYKICPCIPWTPGPAWPSMCAGHVLIFLEQAALDSDHSSFPSDSHVSLCLFSTFTETCRHQSCCCFGGLSDCKDVWAQW